MNIDELVKAIWEEWYPGSILDVRFRSCANRALERDIPKLDRPPMSHEEAERYAKAYILKRNSRYPVQDADATTITEDLVTVLLAPSVKAPRYYVEALGGSYWRVTDRATGAGSAYFSGPKAEYYAKAHAAFAEGVDRTPSMRTDT